MNHFEHHSVMRMMFTAALAPCLLLWHVPFAIADILADASSNPRANSKTEDFAAPDMGQPAGIIKRTATVANMLASDHPSAHAIVLSQLENGQDVADLDIAELVKVKVSPFDVSTFLDKGYRASNSVSGSRFDAPIRDLPFAIQAFTESFIEDQKPVNIFDIARYSPGVTYRSNDGTEGNANLAIRGFAVSATPGNVQILRDGWHGPSIFDFTNISRVEVVKGPASFLYGQVAPGGIVNVITKTPQRQFAATANAVMVPTVNTMPMPT